MNEILKRQAKLRLVRRSVLRDLAVFSQTCIATTLSPQLLLKRKTVLSFVVVNPGKRVVWSEFFFRNHSQSLRNFLLEANLNERHETQRTSQDSVPRPVWLQRSELTVSLQCNRLLFQTADSVPQTHSSSCCPQQKVCYHPVHGKQRCWF